MKRIAALAVLLILILTASVSAFGVTVTEYADIDEAVTVCSGSGMYRLAYSGFDWHIERIAADSFYDDLTLQYPIASTALYGSHAAALCDDLENDQLVLYSYEIDTGVLESYYISSYTFGYHRGFYFDGRVILIQDDDRPSMIRQFSLGGSLKDSFDFQGSSVRFVPGYTSGLYILCDGRLYRYSGGGYQMIGGAALSGSAAFIADDIIADSHGGVYRINNNQCQAILQTDVNSDYPAAVMLNGSVYLADGSIIYRYDPANAQRTDYFDVGYPVAHLYTSGGYLYAATDSAASTVIRVAPSEFLPCPADQPTPAPSVITSSVYRIDSANYRILRIPAPTTFAQLKANIRYDGYDAQLYRDGKSIKTGNVGTAMALVFSGFDSYTYELSVVGDITGEGNVNSRDVGELMDYFLGNIQFDGVYTAAADVNDDGKVDLLDLALLCRAAR